MRDSSISFFSSVFSSATSVPISFQPLAGVTLERNFFFYQGGPVGWVLCHEGRSFASCLALSFAFSFLCLPTPPLVSVPLLPLGTGWAVPSSLEHLTRSTSKQRPQTYGESSPSYYCPLHTHKLGGALSDTCALSLQNATKANSRVNCF